MKKKNFGERLHGSVIWIALIPVVITMVVMFCFSSQTAQESGQISGKITKTVIGIFVKDYDELTPGKREIVDVKVSQIVRKTAHVIEYTALGFFVMLLVEIINLKKRIKPKFLKYLLAFGFSFVYAMSDEYHQKFVSGRASMFSDVLIDGGGAIIGIILLEILTTVLIRKKMESMRRDTASDRS